MDAILILQTLIYGLALGSVTALGAIGVSLTFGVLRFANLATGDLMTLGAFLALAGVTVGAPLWLAAIAAAIGAAAAAWGLDKAVFARLRTRPPVIPLIASFGAALVIRSLIQIIWGTGAQVYAQGVQLPIRIGDLRIKPDHITIFFVALALMMAIHLFLTRTSLGRSMRAVADNRELARISGVRVERVIAWTWIIGGGAAAIAGVLIAMDTRLHPSLGWNLLLPTLAAAILGGIGSVYGAMLGGLLLGVASEFATLFIPAEYREVVAFTILVAVLILKPEGLMGVKR